MSRCFRIALVLACLSSAPTAANSPPSVGAQPQLLWWTHDAGGGPTAGTGLRLDATVGQVDGGPSAPLQAGALILRPGYWGAVRSHVPTLFADGFEISNRTGELP